MSEAALQEEAPAVDSVTAGQLLRQAREAAGLHVAALAVSLKVPVSKLEALEADRLDQLPDAVFVRALASSVCRALKIDAQPILGRLPQNAPPRLVQDRDGLNAPFRAPGGEAGDSWLSQLSKPVFLAVFALLLGALVLILLPTAKRDEAKREEASGAGKTEATPVAPNVAPGTVVEATVARVPPPAAAPSTAPAAPLALTAVAPAPVATPMPAKTASSGAVAAVAKPEAKPAANAAAAAETVTASPAASGTIVFRTKGPSWVEVVDAKGKTVLRRLMDAGESAGASGAMPLSVIVGSADVTVVEVRGKPFNLGPTANDNVARFQVK